MKTIIFLLGIILLILLVVSLVLVMVAKAVDKQYDEINNPQPNIDDDDIGTGFRS